ncbi:bark storage protein A-like isoform X2 [Punica granatum]|uniref:Bark storage protein A-like isoform X2 n=1 Tax=Punica granatum TaxID=22663 RepID=A0A6P8C8W0_PUNGR|nr:bark storage protein A-like isoform X2 [Punica granatum]
MMMMMMMMGNTLLLLFLACFFINPASAPPTMDAPLHSINYHHRHPDGQFLGLLMAYPTEERVLQSSGVFVPDPLTPLFHLAGRRFNIGKIGNVPVVYVMSGEQMFCEAMMVTPCIGQVNAAITVQILVDTFDILGVVHYGTAGSINSSLSLGDVSVPASVALTSSWKWLDFKSEAAQSPELKFGDYNLPRQGPNLLAAVEFTPTQVYSNGLPMKETFWLPVDPKWFDLATQLQNVQLEQCLNKTDCLPETPKVVYGLLGATADVFLDNVAYGQYLFQTFNISTVDEESAAVIMVCSSNEIPGIVFRGISDMAGGEHKLLSGSLSSLAASNALSAALKFIGMFDDEGQQTEPQQQWPLI